jgi:putative glutamine amidotransferase
MENMAGLLLVEGDDIEPKRFTARKANFKYVHETLPLKDEIEIGLLRHALRREVPILGICRGSQLLNVVCGGTLFGDVQKEKGTSRKHIDLENYDTYRHPVSVVPGTPLAGWYRRKMLNVNSYHHQGIRELATRFRPMAHADDGLIEGYYDPGAGFVVGLQFHPERMLKEYAGNLKVWKAFTAAMGCKHRR